MADVSITLTDTGYLSTATGASQESGDYSFSAGTGKANNGVAVTLKASKITYGVGSKLGEEVYRNDSEPSEVSFGGAVDVPGWLLSGVLDMTLAADRKVFGNLMAMYKSKGYKYLSSTNHADNHFMMRYYQNNNGSTNTTNINVRVKKIMFNQDAKSSANSNKVTYTITLVETD